MVHRLLAWRKKKDKTNVLLQIVLNSDFLFILHQGKAICNWSLLLRNLVMNFTVVFMKSIENGPM